MSSVDKIPTSAIEGLDALLDSKVAVIHRYADIAAMILPAAQATQKDGELMRVADATADPNVSSGHAYYDYLGTPTANINDYSLVSAPLSGGGGHIIEDEGTPLAQQDNMNFVGAGVAVTDAGGKTVVTIAGGGGGGGEVRQSLNVTNANYSDALALNATANIIEITLDAALTNDWQPVTITGWVVGRTYLWEIIKESDNGIDLATARAVPNVGYDDDIDPFANLIDIDTTQQRAVLNAVGFKSSFGQFGRLIITDTGYAE